MKKSTITIGERSAAIFITESSMNCPVIYTHFSSDMAEAIAALLADTKVALIALDGVDWDSDLSPWPAPRAFRGGSDFSGGADAYLRELTKNIIPTIENTLGLVPYSRAIMGYSLAGLFSVYALYRTEIFNCTASVSGSLWYDGFIDFMKANHLKRLPERVYFSLGDCEKAVRNQRLALVEHCTSEAEMIVKALGVKTTFEMNPGNHFADVPERIAKAIKWLESTDN